MCFPCGERHISHTKQTTGKIICYVYFQHLIFIEFTLVP
jgi:hypothetical protein